MAVYHFVCEDCNALHVLTQSIHDDLPTKQTCDYCGGTSYQDFSGRNIDVFKPYVDEHSGDTPVLLESKAQRDAYHREQGVSLDSIRYSPPPSQKITIPEKMRQEIMEEVRAGKKAKSASIDPDVSVSHLN